MSNRTLPRTPDRRIRAIGTCDGLCEITLPAVLPDESDAIVTVEAEVLSESEVYLRRVFGEDGEELSREPFRFLRLEDVDKAEEAAIEWWRDCR